MISVNQFQWIGTMFFGKSEFQWNLNGIKFLCSFSLKYKTFLCWICPKTFHNNTIWLRASERFSFQLTTIFFQWESMSEISHLIPLPLIHPGFETQRSDGYKYPRPKILTKDDLGCQVYLVDMPFGRPHQLLLRIRAGTGLKTRAQFWARSK